ncbi:MAG: hypothetical protein HOP04_10705 [Methylophilaceae bacterium]|nr:hypothetical protein [Methylophilaceae bacterium]
MAVADLYRRVDDHDCRLVIAQKIGKTLPPEASFLHRHAARAHNSHQYR